MTSPSQPTITIIETGIANTASVAAAFERLGARVARTRAPDDVATADRVVLPGVGAFGAGMGSLRATELVGPLRDRLRQGKPTLAICLGLQLLCRASDESPGEQGLGVIDADVVAFPPGTRVPQFGWNRVEPDRRTEMIQPGHAYFANSYRLASIPDGWRGAMADHAGPFVAAIERGDILACQCHPELSGRWGAELLRRWLARRMEAVAC